VSPRSLTEPSRFPPLFIRDLTVAYDEMPALWDIDLDVPEGALMAVVGPNGAGKSTLIKAALGLIPRAAGTVRLFGEEVRLNRGAVAYVPQRSAVDWDFPTDALDVVMMGMYGRLGWLRRPGRRERERAMESLDQVGMADFARRQISRLSGGQQQRVFIARALAQDARLLIMDEPMAGVDAVTEAAIFEVMSRLQREGRTLLVVHHDLESVAERFDHVALLNIRLVAAGPTSETLIPENLALAYGSAAEAK
jgi:manganese/zinc/iron transport system ATP- binding protein